MNKIKYSSSSYIYKSITIVYIYDKNPDISSISLYNFKPYYLVIIGWLIIQ